jgi:hypothetical protein
VKWHTVSFLTVDTLEFISDGRGEKGKGDQDGNKDAKKPKEKKRQWLLRLSGGVPL